MTTGRLFGVVLVALGLVACGPTDPLQLDTIQIGRSLNPDSSIAEHVSSFRRNDTIYASVLTTAPGRGIIRLRWMFQGRAIGEPTREVTYREPAATSFHLVNSGGFPPGAYTVEVFIDDKPAGTKTVRVE